MPYQPPCHKVVETLLLDMRLCLEYGYHHNGEIPSPLYQGLPSAIDPDQRLAAKIGGQYRPSPLPIDKRGIKNIHRNKH